MVGRRNHITRRTVLGLFSAGALASAIVGCAPSGAPATPAGGQQPATQAPTAAPAGASQQAIPMKLGIATVNDVQHEWMRRYKERLERRTNGQLAVEIYPSNQLGLPARILEGLQLGTIEGWMGPPDFAVGIESRFMVPGIPLLFRGIEDIPQVTSDNTLMDRFLNLSESKGIKGVSLVMYGPMIVLARDPVRTPDDLRGKKIRVFAAPPEIETMNAWGAAASPLALGEVPTALQQGAIDGAQTGITVGDTLKLYDMVRYATETHHSVITSLGAVSKPWFDRLPADVQQAVVEEGRAVQQELYDWQIEQLQVSSNTWNERTNGGLIRLSAQERQVFLDELTGVRDRVLEQRPEIRETLELFESKVRAIHS